MRNFLILLSLSTFLFSCGDSQKNKTTENNDSNTETEEISDNSANESDIDLSGKWSLQSFVTSDSEKDVYTDCDSKTTWHFSNEAEEPLGDGTEVNKLMVTAPEDCKYYDFEAKWTTSNGQLFMSTTRVGGMGGFSLAGLFTIESSSANEFVVSSKKATFTFAKK